MTGSAPNGAYDIAQYPADAASVRSSLTVPVYVYDRSTLAALDTTKDKRAYFDGSVWDWTTGNYSALVAADTLGGKYIKATAIASSAGAWVRDGNAVDPRWFGATGNGVIVAATCSINSGTAALTATGAAFTSADVGKLIVVPGAGAAGAPLATTIAGYTNATHVTLTANAGTTLAAVATEIAYGTDDRAAIQAALDLVAPSNTPASRYPFYFSTNTVYIPAGVYALGGALIKPAGIEIEMDAGAHLKAMATMTAVIDTLEVDYLDLHNNARITGGIVDCSDLANHAIKPRYFADFEISHVTMLAALVSYVPLGSLTAPAGSYGAHIHENLMRRSLTPFPAGLVGINFIICGDSEIYRNTIVGVKYGVAGTYYDSKFWANHVWNPVVGSSTSATVALSIGFSINGEQNQFWGNQIDGPFVAGGGGFYAVLPGNSIIGNSVNNVTNDANAQGIYIEIGAGATTVIGNTFKGNSGTERLAADVAGEVTGATILGNRPLNVVTVTAETVQPLDADLTAIAALPTTSFGRSLLTQAAASNARTTLGLGTSAVIDTGVSGATVPLLNGINIWSASQTINGNSVALPAPPSGGLLQVGGADAANTRLVIDAFGGQPIINGRRSVNTAAAPQTVVNGSQLLNIGGIGHDGTAYGSGSASNVVFVALETWSTSAHGAGITFTVTPTGSLTAAEQLRIAADGSLVHRGNATTIVDTNSHVGLRSYTVSTLPSAATAARLIYVSDGTSNKRLAVSDGTNWRWPDGAIVS